MFSVGREGLARVSVKEDYLDSVSLIERLHRQFLEIVKLELDRIGARNINNVQALILYHIGEDQLTVGELTQRGYYLGTNVTYNLKKLVENKYVSQSPSPHDRRAVHIKLTAAGLKLHKSLDAVFTRHVDALARTNLKGKDFASLMQALRSLEQFWIAGISRGGYGP